MLRDRITMITGASAGIGAATARILAGAGARLILAARRRERIAALADELHEQHGTDTHLLSLDVRDRAAVFAAIDGLPTAWQEIDILVNNAGLSRGLEPVHEGDPADWEEMIDTNVKGLLWVTRAVLPGMVARDRGHVINIGSVSGRDVYPGGAVYCSTKFAVRALTTGLRIDLKGTRVRVSTVDPGQVETEFSLVRFHGDKERADAVYTQFPPLQPDDVAEAVLFCATRPPHVNIAEIVLWPTDQKTVTISHPRGR